VAEDKQKHFLLPFWEVMQSKAYLELIKHPMCFSIIRNNLKTHSKKYLFNLKLFKQDIERIFVNAKTFNASSTEVYKAAHMIHEKANQIMSNKPLMEIIDNFSKQSIEEAKFLNYVRN
jgi:hypothetical protein